MPTNFIVDIPVANIVKMILDGAEQNQFARYDQQRLSLVENASMDIQRYLCKMINASTFNFQHYTNFPYSILQWLDCDGELVAGSEETSPTKLVQYTNLFYRSTCMFSSIGGKLFIFFEDTQQFEDEDFATPTDLTRLNGRLPQINAKVGDVVRYNINGSGFVISAITDIVWSPTLQAQGYLIDVDATLLDADEGVVEINYDEREADLWQALINVPPTSQKECFLHLKVGLSSTQILGEFTSEPIETAPIFKTCLPIKYRHDGEFSDKDHWGFLYGEDYYNTLYVDAQFYKFVMAGENDVDNGDTGVERLLRSVPYRQLIFTAMNIPGWVADKIQIILAHDTKIVNEYRWEIESFGSYELIEQMDIGTLEVNLRQVDDRTKFVNKFEIDLVAAFTPDTLSFDEDGESKGSLFNTNTGLVFTLTGVPSWLHPNDNTPVDGQTIAFTADSNDTPLVRSAVIIAVCALTGIIATITVSQEADSSITLFLETDENVISLSGASNSFFILNVTSSGDYNVTTSGAWTFQWMKQSGFSQLKISEATENDGTTSRTGKVRLELIANPAIFVEVDVEQGTFDGIYSVSPGLITRNNAASIPGGGENHNVYVDAHTTAQWKATSPQSGPPATGLNSWLHFDKSVQVGPKPTFSILMDAKPPYVPNRVGTVTFYRISDPSDAVILTIQQNT